MRICVCSVLLVVKHFPQISQVKGFSPVEIKTSAGGQRFKQHPVSTRLTCVSSQVLFQLGCVHELVMTLSTFRQRFTFVKRDPTQSSSASCIKRGDEILTCVNSVMALKLPLLSERLSALLALK